MTSIRLKGDVEQRADSTVAARDDYFNQFYSDLPLSVIRAWERESSQRWPPPWASGWVNYLDIYANEDEINHTKEASEWSLNEGQPPPRISPTLLFS